MSIEALIDTSVEPLQADESPQHALNALIDSRLSHLPVVEKDNVLVGLVSENQLMSSLGSSDSLANMIGATPISVSEEAHPYNVARIFTQHQISAVPVTGPDNQYRGVVTRSNLLDRLARMLATQERGAILELEVPERDYSLGQLMHLVEQSDVKVLSVATEDLDQPTDALRVTLKLDDMEATRVRHMLSHHGYRVQDSYNETESREDLQDRVQEFMKYLGV